MTDKEWFERIRSKPYFNYETRDNHVNAGDIQFLIKRVEELENEIKSHAPEGRNYTNGKYVELLLENLRYEQALKQILYFDEKYGSLPSYEDCKSIAQQALKYVSD